MTNTYINLHRRNVSIAEAQAKADKHEVRLIIAEDINTGHVGITSADNLFVNVNGHEFNLRVIAVVEPMIEEG